MDALMSQLWGKRLLETVERQTAFERLFPPTFVFAPAKPLTKRELLAQIIGEFMEYDGDPEGAADAVMEFYDKLNSDS